MEFCNFVFKETPTEMFSCEFWEIFKNTCFVEHLRTAIFLMSIRQKRLSYVVEQLHHALCFTNFMKDCVSRLKTTQKHLKSNFLYSSQTHNYVIIVNILYICMFFHNSHKTPEQMAENWRKALMPNKKLHVLFLPKV